MKLSVKTFALLASLVPLVHASTPGDVTHDFLRRVLDTACEANQDEPDGRVSQIVELSYYNQLTLIDVSITDGIPDKVFKFSGCGVETGTQFGFLSDDSNDPQVDPVFTFWTRAQLNYTLKDCVDGSICLDEDEMACGCLAHYDDEFYFRPGLKDGGNGTYRVKYKATPVGWPCFDSVTATYVQGSTVLDFDAGVQDNIVADFFYTGEKTDRKFDVVIFGDQTCTLGNEIAGTVGGPYPNPPFVVTIDDPLPGSSYPTEYTQVRIEANPTEWATTYWDPDTNDADPGKIGELKICLQFQVRADTDPYHMHEFVDVAYKIDINLMEDCSCDTPGAKEKETTEEGRNSARCHCPCSEANPTCGSITLIRDYVIGEGLETDPDIGMTCAPCEGNMTVTQGEKFPVCMALINDGDDYCLSDVKELSLTVWTSSSVSTIYQILPTPEDDRIIAGDLECDDDGMCVIQMTPPAELIAQLDAGDTSSSYTGYFAGAAEVDFGTCDNRRRELKEAVYATFVGQEFTMNYAKKEEGEECDGRFFAKLLCRFREWLRQIRGKS